VLIPSRKKKAKSKAKHDSDLDRERERVREMLLQEESSMSPFGGRSHSPAVDSDGDRKTKAERRFEEVQRRRVNFDSYTIAVQLIPLLF
jgi:protein FAM32A